MNRIIVDLDQMDHDWFTEAGCPEQFRGSTPCPPGADYTCFDCWMEHGDGAVVAVTLEMEAALAELKGAQYEAD